MAVGAGKPCFRISSSTELGNSLHSLKSKKGLSTCECEDLIVIFYLSLNCFTSSEERVGIYS